MHIAPMCAIAYSNVFRDIPSYIICSISFHFFVVGNIFVLFVRSLDVRGDEYYIQHVDYRLGTYFPAILNVSRYFIYDSTQIPMFKLSFSRHTQLLILNSCIPLVEYFLSCSPWALNNHIEDSRRRSPRGYILGHLGLVGHWPKLLAKVYIFCVVFPKIV